MNRVIINTGARDQIFKLKQSKNQRIKPIRNQMKAFAIAHIFAAASAIQHLELKYMNYLAEFGKVINNLEEFEQRLENFIATDKAIENMNAEGNTWTAGHNQFSDWSKEEYKSILGAKKPIQSSDEDAKLTSFDETKNADTLNWRDWGAVTPVKNQGQCGSCWAFASTGALEGAHFVASGQLETFSEQQLVDCTTNLGNYGCQGGWPYYSAQYYKTNGAIRGSDYAYTSSYGQVTGYCYDYYYASTGVNVSDYR